ncbi:hypothetical protein GGS24DRAFT_499032 [Hypoxylon argillaceum]|nr:hypothetical protein GGS24DRAFT_499032 [Hypoxylon argillaceum]KAI1145284.1 hypothetical protein F4825DRAFT_457658 [Nemania diffusa]
MDSSKSPTEQQQQQSSTTRRRRVSVYVRSVSSFLMSSGPSYESLMNYKRSNDPNSMARRASLNEQKPQSGFFGSMWHKYVLPAPTHLPSLSSPIFQHDPVSFPCSSAILNK